MTVFEITKPGTWLNLPNNHQLSFEVQNLIDQLIECFYEANQALNLFDSEYSKSYSMQKETWEKDRKEREIVEEQLKKDIGDDNFYIPYEEMRLKVDTIFNRQKWERGILPNDLKRKNIFIFAKSFLFALDNFQKVFKALLDKNKTSELYSHLEQSYNEFCDYFKDLREVRNSAHHSEDRIQGLSFGKPIPIKPLSNDFIKADSGALLLNVLNNRNYGNTLGNGYYGEVEVSIESLEFARKIVQNILESFQWKGPKMYLPR